jgi:penicillin-binding protein 1C
MLKPIKRLALRSASAFLVMFTLYQCAYHCAAWLAERALPEVLFDRPYAARLLDRDGVLLGARVAEDGQWRFQPSERPLPPRLVRALVMFEDQRFWSHGGVDLIAVLRALKSNLLHQRVVSGASTLSMQVMRLALRRKDRSLSTKLYEAWLTLGLERRYSKEQILRLYMAHAPFGGNVVGLEAAAWRYFGRSPEELTWAEGAMLAVLPNQPGMMHLKRNRSALKLKRDQLLDELLDQGELTELDAQLARAEPLPTLQSKMPHEALHFFDTARAALRKAGERTPNITTSLHAPLQRALNRVAERYAERLAQQGIHNLALVVLNNHTLLPEAYIGNVPSLKARQAPHLDLVQRARSTGSTLKPLLFAGMLDAGDIVPSSLIPDVPTRFHHFKPLNADRAYRGAVSAEEALIKSLNVPAVRMLRRYGVPLFYRLLTQLGLSTLTREASEYGAALIIGGAEGELWELTRAYALLAHHLLYPSEAERAHAQKRGREGLTPMKNFMEHPLFSASLPLSRGATWLTFQVLTQVTRPRTFQHGALGERPIAWKTGTSQGHRDGWSIGLTPSYTVGVWIGNAHGGGRPGLTGSRAAAPLLFEVFSHLERRSQGGEIVWFERPDEALEQVKICDKSGYLPAEGCPERSTLKPKGAPFVTQDHFYQRLHLDESGLRVTSACVPITELRQEARFILPPSLALYYQQHNAYTPLPPYKEGCEPPYAQSESLEVVTPHEGADLYLPRLLDGSLSSLVLKARTARTGEALYWHLDGEYLGLTRDFHELSCSPEPGKHTLVVVSEHGERLTRHFITSSAHPPILALPTSAQPTSAHP